MNQKLLFLLIGIFWSCGFAYAQPGFTCAEAMSIGTLPYTTSDNTANYGDTYDVGFIVTGNDVFYTFTPTESGNVAIILESVEENPSITVFTNCNDIFYSTIGSASAYGPTLRVIPALAVTAGVSYRILVSSYSGTQTVAYSMTILKQNCLIPTGFSDSNVTSSTADLSWNAPANVSAYEIVVQPEGLGMPTGAGTPVVGNSFTATGLNSGTTYEYWVRSNCGDGTFSVWNGAGTFWTLAANSLCSLADQCNYTFHLVDTFGDSWNGNSVTVRQNGLDVVTITLDGNTHMFNYQAIVPLCNAMPFELYWNAGGDFPNEVVVSIINPFNQTIYHKPAGVGTQDSLLFQENVNCIADSCPAPSNVHFSDLSAGSASVTWTELNASTQWEVLALPAGSPAPVAADTGTVTSENPFTVTGLVDGGEYDFYVRAICAEGFISDWTLPVSAIATCPTPPTPTWYGGDSYNNVSWDPGLASQWEVIVQPAGLPAPNAASSGVIVTNNQYNIDSTVEGSFDVYVRAICSSSESEWSLPYTIEITCAQVYDVNVTGNVLSWTSNASATLWEIRVYEGNVSYPNNNPNIYEVYQTSANPFVIPDIVIGDDYTVFVRALCDAEDTGLWSTQRFFVYTGPLGIAGVQGSDFVVYPNPATYSVTVSLPLADNLQTITLYDMVGKTVTKEVDINKSETTIDLSSLAKGIYLLEVVTDKQTKVTKKLVIQ